MSSQGISDSKKRKRADNVIKEDFEELARKYPQFSCELQAVRAKQQQTGGSFSSSVTQEFNISLTRALIHFKFGVVLPSLPLDRLCPPVPNRWAYVQWLQNDLTPLLCKENDYFAATEPLKYYGIDIGTGASCIYPILLTSSNKEWNVIGTEVDALSIESARANVKANHLEDHIQIQLVKPTREQQQESGSIYTSDCTSSGGPIARALECCSHDSTFDFVMVNPPFFDTAQGAEPRADERDRTPMTSYEGHYPGGEFGFVCDMIRDSLVVRDRVGWYSAMCGKKTSFTRLKQILVHLLGPGHVQSMEFSPGYMTRWFLAWTFRRPKIKSPAAKITGGIHSFNINVDEKRDEADALDDVAARVDAYCDMLPGWSLSTTVSTVDHGKVVSIVEASPAPVELLSQVDDAEKLPERVFDGIHQDWDANLFLPKEGHFLVEVTAMIGQEPQQDGESGKSVTVSVSLACYRHSGRGAKAVEKFRSKLQGEICRSNRRWRRIFKRQAEQGTDSLTKLTS